MSGLQSYFTADPYINTTPNNTRQSHERARPPTTMSTKYFKIEELKTVYIFCIYSLVHSIYVQFLFGKQRSSFINHKIPVRS